jgi:hypothetical protein
MTTYDSDTLDHDPAVLRRIVQELGGRLVFDEIRDKDGLGAALRWRAAQFVE